MQIYHYHQASQEFLSASQADESPLEPGVFLIPANATAVQPPAHNQGQASVFNGSSWSIVDDYRGTIYYLLDGSRYEITELGIAPPVASSPAPPPPTFEEQKLTLLSAVNRERSKRWRAGFPVLIGGVTKWFHSDEFSLTQHLGLKDKARDLLAAGGVMTDDISIAGQPVSWSTMDGSQVQITAQVAFDIVAAGALNQALIFAASQAHEAAINAATNLDNYDALTGWPSVFGD